MLFPWAAVASPNFQQLLSMAQLSQPVPLSLSLLRTIRQQGVPLQRRPSAVRVLHLVVLWPV